MVKIVPSMLNATFWSGVISGIVVWVVGSLIWSVIFQPLLRAKGYSV